MTQTTWFLTLASAGLTVVLGAVLMQASIKIACALVERQRNRRQLVLWKLKRHFRGVVLDRLAITERRYPAHMRADVQRAIDAWLMGQVRLDHFGAFDGERADSGPSFKWLTSERRCPTRWTAPEFSDIDIGEEQPVRSASTALWLVNVGGQPLAVLMGSGSAYENPPKLVVQIASPDRPAAVAAANDFIARVQQAIERAPSYRGKVLSFDQQSSYSGQSTGICVHKLRKVARHEVVLAPATLDLVDRNIVQFVRQRAELVRLGRSAKKGLLFYGPPGTGKTHTLHYLIGALEGHTTLIIDGSAIGSLAEYMTLARMLAPALVVIEDADLIARQREDAGSPCQEMLLNKLLNEMDGLKEDAEILFVLTTNRAETLEQALTARPGRIDQAIEFPVPDLAGREKLVRLYSAGLTIDDEIVQLVAARTERMSAAFIKELMRRATQELLVRGGGNELELSDLEAALDELVAAGGQLTRRLLGAGPERSIGFASDLEYCPTLARG